MSCGGVCALALLAAIPARIAQSAPGRNSATQVQPKKPSLPSGPMQEKAGMACLGCHTAQIIVQQQLDRRGWAKEVDKMIRWGTLVSPEDREALIDYLVKNFGPRENGKEEATLPPGPGVEKVRAVCLACHDAGNIVAEGRDARGWTRILNKMEDWGAVIPSAERETILTYLVTQFPPPGATSERKEEKPK
jgi:hypothetical protein